LVKLKNQLLKALRTHDRMRSDSWRWHLRASAMNTVSRRLAPFLGQGSSRGGQILNAFVFVLLTGNRPHPETVMRRQVFCTKSLTASESAAT